MYVCIVEGQADGNTDAVQKEKYSIDYRYFSIIKKDVQHVCSSLYAGIHTTFLLE